MPTKRNKTIRAAKKSKSQPIQAFSLPVSIKCEEGEGTSPATFDVTAYNGGALEINGWDKPVVIDLEGLAFSRSVIANLDHESRQRVGHVTSKEKTENQLKLSGVFSASTPYRDEVVNSAKAGFAWEASVEVQPHKVTEIDAGQKVKVNGQEFTGPLYLTRTGTMTGFGFVSHGADRDTQVSIAAIAASHKEHEMDKELEKWIKAMGFDPEDLTETQLANLKADFEGRAGSRPKINGEAPKDSMERRRMEAARRKEIKQLADEWCDNAIEMERYDDVEEIRAARDAAIKEGTSVSDFRYELKLATLAEAPPAIRSVNKAVTNKVLEAAICQAGGLQETDHKGKPHYDDQSMQLAHDNFKGRIALSDIFRVAAEANGYTGRLGSKIDIDMQNAAFGLLPGSRGIRGGGFSTISLPNTFSNIANKAVREGFMAVDMTPTRIAGVKSTSDFKQVTTLSLTGDFQFTEVGPDGEIKHATVGEETYNNQVTLAATMFALTMVDYRNDDAGVLVSRPKRIGRGGGLYLNHKFWTVFLNNSSFFTTGRGNANEGVADMTVGGLAATETMFVSQTDPDGKPLGATPRILLVPTALHAKARTLMNSERLIDGTSTAAQGDANIWKDRFRVESSPYMHNTAYTGNSAQAWYMLADPTDLPVVEIAALDGQLTPYIESADAAFNVLGTQMRGWFAIGVAMQEYRGGVRADGNAS